MIPFLIADGATQTSFSNIWASCLVNTCSRAHLSEISFLKSVRKAQEEWQNSLQDIDLPWHAQEKFRQGAYSALTWLEIGYDPLHPAYAFTWRALAVGDCCLFISRSHSVYLSLPLQEPIEFTNNPVLIPSKSEKIGSITGKIQTARGSLKNGDHLLLATDALSAWIVKQTQENQDRFFRMLMDARSTHNPDSITSWINNLRRKNEIKNDDTSLVFIELGEGNR